MVHLLRKYQQSLLIAITILVILSFVWYWNGSQGGRAGFAGENSVATIYGKGISEDEIQRVRREFKIAQALGLDLLLQGLIGNAQSEQDAVENFIINSYVLHHEADDLQIFPSDSEVQDELSHVPAFQTDGRFDPAKLTDFVQTDLPPQGFSDTVIDDLLRDQVRIKKLVGLVASTVTLSPQALKNRFEDANEKMDLSVVRLNTSDLEKGIPITDAQAKAEYDQHADQYKSEEQRRVKIASFELTDAQKELKGKERTDALQKLGDKAWTLAQAVVDKNADFDAQAKKTGAVLAESAFFTTDQPDPAYAKTPAIAATAFKLSTDYPSSDVVEGTNGYYVLHLDGVNPSKPLTFEQAKPAVIANMQRDRAAQMMQTVANGVHDHLVAALKGGKSFADAAASSALSAETIPPFALIDVSKLDVPDLQQIVQTAISLQDGQVSDFVPTSAGGFFVYMKGREPIAPSEAAAGEAAVKDQFTRQGQFAAFLEWMRIRRSAAHLQTVHG